MGITNPGEEYFKNGSWGWNGSEWVKAGLLFSYHDQLMEQVRDTNAPAGAFTISLSAIPAGEVWVVTSVFAYDMDNALTAIHYFVTHGAIGYRFAVCGALAAAVGYSWAGQVYAEATDVVSARFYGLTLNDDIQMNVFGYILKVT